MKEQHLHIVTHDVPWPADYGGVIDLFYKIKELHSQGVHIHLHCFTQKNRLPQKVLDQYCASVNYYPRKKNVFNFSFTIPFIVNSRRSKELLENLSKNNYPVLLEGIHCTYLIYTGKLHNRKIIIRLHNVECEYYKYLAKHEGNFFKKLYFIHESRLLKKYEAAIAEKNNFLTVSKTDEEFYRSIFNAKAVQYLPVFIPWATTNNKTGKGEFCLYHGNLSVNENEEAAIWLLQYVFNDLKIPFIIAGKNPSAKLKSLVSKHQQASLIGNPDNDEMINLISNAQINILPSLNNTGIKLKLLFALFNGRHCIVNTPGVSGSELENICHIADDIPGYKKLVQQLYEHPFTGKFLLFFVSNGITAIIPK